MPPNAHIADQVVVLLTFYKMWQTNGEYLPNFQAACLVLTMETTVDKTHRSPLVHTMYRDGRPYTLVRREIRELIRIPQEPSTTYSY